MISFFLGEGFKKLVGSCKGFVIMWIGIGGLLVFCVSDFFFFG